MNHPYDTQLHSLPLKPQLRTYVCKRYQQTAYLPYFVDLDLTLYIPLSSKPFIKPRPQDLSARSRNPQSNPDERLHYLYLPPLNPIACLTMCELTITIIISSAGKPPRSDCSRLQHSSHDLSHLDNQSEHTSGVLLRALEHSES